MKRLVKGLLCIVLMCVILFEGFITVQAEGEDSSLKDSEGYLRNLMEDAALEWASIFEPGSNYQIGEVIPVYNVNEVIVSYYVSYLRENKPYGYVVLTVQDEKIDVLEFSLEEGMDLYGTLEENIEFREKREKKLYSSSPFEFAIKNENGDFYGKSKEKEVETSWKEDAISYQKSVIDTKRSNRFTATQDLTASVITGAGQPMIENLSGYTVKEQDSIPGAVGYSENYIEMVTGRYACAVMALTEIAAQEKILLNNSIEGTFNNLWTLTDTSVYKTRPDGIQLGSTSLNGQVSGMVQYCNNQGKNCATDVTWSPKYSLIREAIRFNISGTLNYWYTNEDNEESGHTVSVVGYCAAAKGGTTKNFAIVYDGWNNHWRYFNLSDYTFNRYCYVQYDLY